MTIRREKLFGAVGVVSLILVIMLVVLWTRSSWAAGTANVKIVTSLTDRMVMSSVNECIRRGRVVADEVSIVAENIRETDTDHVIEQMFNPASSMVVPLPSFVTDIETNGDSSTISCYGLFVGDGWGFGARGTYPGVMGYFGISSMAAREQLQMFGFSPEQTGTGSDVATKRVVFTTPDGYEVPSTMLTVKANGDAPVIVTTSGDMFTSGASDNLINIGVSGNGLLMKLQPNVRYQISGGDYRILNLERSPVLTDAEYIRLTQDGYYFEYSSNTVEGFFAELYEGVRQFLMGNTITYGASGVQGGLTLTLQEDAIEVAADSDKTWKHVMSDINTAESVMDKLSGGQWTQAEMTFGGQEVLSYYVAQLNQHYFEGVAIDDFWVCDETITGDSLLEIDLVPTSGTGFARPPAGSPCKIKTTVANDFNKNDMINGFSVPNQRDDGEVVLYFGGSAGSGPTSYRRMDLAGLVAAINELVPLILAPGDVIEPETNPGATVEPTNGPSAIEMCYNSGAIDSLGWIVCPVMSWLGDTAQMAYDTFVEPALRVPPKLVTPISGGNNDAHDAWVVFRDIANVIFVVILVIVVLSQLTGVGIDNYGIKRILPKLVVMAIMVNLSFLICQLCVDLSNIIGNGIQNLFKTLASTLGSTGVDVGGTVVGAVATTSISAVAIAGGLYAAGAAVWAAPGIIMALLVSMLGLVISLLFLFILLAAREAAIVVLIVLSPLAFVCYVLPNTKGYFDKWRKMLMGLLLLYPICGLLVGGGSYVSKLILTIAGQNGFFTAFTALLAGIIPIFFIPKVLRDSFAALGSLGATIQGFGQRFARGTTGAVRGSEGYKNLQRASLDRRTRIRAGLDKNGRLTGRGERMAQRSRGWLGRTLGADKRQAAYIAAAQKDIAAREQAEASLLNAASATEIDKAGGDARAYYNEQIVSAARNNDYTGVKAGLAAAVSSGYLKDKDVAKIMRNMLNNGDLDIKGAQGAAFMRDLATTYGNGFLASDFELRHFAMSGGLSNGGVLGGYGQYAKSAPITVDEIKPDDVNRLSGDSLAGMLASGAISRNMARRVMAANPNISEDKKIMLGAAAAGATITDAAQFKAQAEAAMKAGSGLIGSIDATAEMVSAWASATPQAVSLAQDYSGDINRAHSQALIDSAEFDVRRAQEIERAHGEALEENKQREMQAQRDATQERIAQALEQMGGGGANGGGTGGTGAGAGGGGGT